MITSEKQTEVSGVVKLNDDELKVSHAQSHRENDETIHAQCATEMENRGISHNSPLSDEDE